MNKIKPISLRDQFFHWIETLWYKWRVSVWVGKVMNHLPQEYPTDVASQDQMIQRIFQALFAGDFFCERKKLKLVKELIEKNRPLNLMPPLKPITSSACKEEIRQALQEMFKNSQTREFANILTDRLIPPNVIEFTTQDISIDVNSEKKLPIEKKFEIFLDKAPSATLGEQGIQFMAHFNNPSWAVSKLREWGARQPTIKVNHKISGSIDYARKQIRYDPGCIRGELPDFIPESVLKLFNVPKSGTVLSLELTPNLTLEATIADTSNPQGDKYSQEWSIDELKNSFGDIRWSS